MQQMSDEKPFFTPRFTGERFKGALPLSVLEDLSAYEDLLIEVAKYLFFEENQGRKRVPNGFNEGVSLELSNIDEGSSIPQILLVGILSFNPGHLYLDKARDRISNVVELASNNQSVNSLLPDHLLKKFNRIGKNLGEGESIEFTPSEQAKSILSKNTRKNIIFSAGEKFFTEKISFRAKVTGYDKLTKECTIRISDTVLKFTPPASNVKLLLDAFNGYEGGGNKILVKAEVKKDRADKIDSIAYIESIDKLDALDVPSRIDELRSIENGWLDGNGVAMNNEGLTWFSKSFEEHFSDDLPLPYIFPMPDGGIQLEWNTIKFSANLELNLINKKGEYFCITKETRAINEDDLDFNDKAIWSKFNELIKILL
jgi:hypothetical protein